MTDTSLAQELTQNIDLNNSRILDLACGPGNLSFRIYDELKLENVEFYCVDIGQHPLIRDDINWNTDYYNDSYNGQANLNHGKPASCFHTILSDDKEFMRKTKLKFDFIISSSRLHFLDGKEKREYILLMKSILNPKGSILIKMVGKNYEKEDGKFKYDDEIEEFLKNEFEFKSITDDCAYSKVVLLNLT